MSGFKLKFLSRTIRCLSYEYFRYTKKKNEIQLEQETANVHVKI